MSYPYDFLNPKSLNIYTEQNLKQKFGFHRNYLLAALHEIKFNFMKQLLRLEYIREKEFEKLLISITCDPKKTIADIEQNIFNWYVNEKIYIASEKEKIDLALQEFTNSQIKTVEKSIGSIQERKRKKLIETCDKYAKYITTNYKNNPKSTAIILSFQKLKSILSRKQGFLTYNISTPLIQCFRSNRNWNQIEKSHEILYPPIPKSDSLTNQIIINLYGIITDSGTNPTSILNSYFKQKP